MATLLTGCVSTAVSPRGCRALGVDVPNGATITGEIVEEHYRDAFTVKAACQSPFSPKYGCAIPVTEGRYILFAVNAEVMAHERCHALYETGEHTGNG